MKIKFTNIITTVGFLILMITLISNTITVLKQRKNTVDYNFLFQAEYTKQKKQLENCYNYLEDAKKEFIYLEQLAALKQLDSCLKNYDFTKVSSATIKDLSINLGLFKTLNSIFIRTKLEEEESINFLIGKVSQNIGIIIDSSKFETNRDKVNLKLERDLSKIDTLLTYFIHINPVIFLVNIVCLIFLPVLIELVFFAICTLVIIIIYKK